MKQPFFVLSGQGSTANYNLICFRIYDLHHRKSLWADFTSLLERNVVFWHAAFYYPSLPPKNQPIFVSKCLLKHTIGEFALLQPSNHLCAESCECSFTTDKFEGAALTSCYAMAPDQTNQFTGTMLIIFMHGCTKLLVRED